MHSFQNESELQGILQYVPKNQTKNVLIYSVSQNDQIESKLVFKRLITPPHQTM